MVNYISVQYLCLFPILFLMTFNIQAEKIQIVTENFAPYNYIENNQLVGIHTSLIKKILAKTQTEAEFHIYPWARAYNMALQQQNTLIYSIARSKNREHLFQWVGPITPVTTCLFALKSRTDINFNDLEPAKNYITVTQLEGRTEHVLIGKGFVKGQNLMDTTSLESSFKVLLNARSDLLGYPELPIYHLIKQQGLKPNDIIKKTHCFTDAELYMAFSLNTPLETVEKFQTALDELLSVGEYKNIFTEYQNTH
ncbi:MAG: polar amino acid transport system substrate-binding protein [Alteromonadaceae bacterium]|jgi:polar amino acid transport system substrate-binding protein